MGDYSELKPGYRWVRQVYGFDRFSSWCVVHLTGKPPFLHGHIVFVAGDREPDIDWFTNPEDWEFGPDLEIPKEKRT